MWYNFGPVIRGVAQPGSASALGAECRRFKSSRPDHSKCKLHDATDDAARLLAGGVVAVAAVHLEAKNEELRNLSRKWLPL